MFDRLLSIFRRKRARAPVNSGFLKPKEEPVKKPVLLLSEPHAPQPVEDIQPAIILPPVEKPPVEIKMPEEMPPEITKPLKLNATTLISSVSLPFNTATVPPMIVREPMIFHDWPDKCPGLTGAVPVLNNYVPATIVLIITEKFKGHLYSISTTKGPDNQQQYKLKVCEDGMIQYEYADYKGNIIPKE
jgi:hypothetical protein